jgi:hypothetical protein
MLLPNEKKWLFSSGPTGEGEPVELTKGWRFPKTQASHLTQKEKSQ